MEEKYIVESIMMNYGVDNYHTGGSAHIEVFSGNHTFKGTSHIYL